MNYTVLWLPRATNELAAVWTTAVNRPAVTVASHSIDQRLAADPLDEGESRGGNERIGFEPPLRVLFRVFEADRRVEVYSVSAFRRRS